MGQFLFAFVSRAFVNPHMPNPSSHPTTLDLVSRSFPASFNIVWAGRGRTASNFGKRRAVLWGHLEITETMKTELLTTLVQDYRLMSIKVINAFTRWRYINPPLLPGTIRLCKSPLGWNENSLICTGKSITLKNSGSRGIFVHNRVNGHFLGVRVLWFNMIFYSLAKTLLLYLEYTRD